MASPAFRRTVIKKGGVQGGAGMKAHYIAREDCYGPGVRKVEYLGQTTTHEVRGDLVWAETSKNLPAWAKDAAEFFHAAETFERSNGVVLTEIKFDLPKDLTCDQQLALTRDFLHLHLGENHVVSWAMHEPLGLSGKPHPHVHLIWNAREVDEVERTPQQFFRKPEAGGARKTPALNQWNAPAIEKQLYCDVANWHLAQAGVATRFHPGSHTSRGLALVKEPKLWPSDSYAYEHKGITTKRMQELLDHREKMAPHRAAEAEDAQQYWEHRKARLGLVHGITHELALERIAHARTLALTTPPRQRSAYVVEQDRLGIEQSITALENFERKLSAELALESAYLSTGKERHPQGIARVEALLSQGRQHGIDIPAPSRERAQELPIAARVRQLAQSLEHGVEDEAGGPGLQVRLHDKERGRGEGMSW